MGFPTSSTWQTRESCPPSRVSSVVYIPVVAPVWPGPRRSSTTSVVGKTWGRIYQNIQLHTGRGSGDSQPVLGEYYQFSITNRKFMIEGLLVYWEPLSAHGGCLLLFLSATLPHFWQRCGSSAFGHLRHKPSAEVTLAVPQHVSSNHNLNDNSLMSR